MQRICVAVLVVLSLVGTACGASPDNIEIAESGAPLERAEPQQAEAEPAPAADDDQASQDAAPAADDDQASQDSAPAADDDQASQDAAPAADDDQASQDAAPAADDDQASQDAAPEIGLDQIALVTTEVMEFDRIYLDGVDSIEDLSGLLLELSLPDGDMEPHPLPLFQDDSGFYGLLSLHPQNPGQGGPISLQLVDDNTGQRSQRFDLQLTGLPDAPGAWQATIDALLTDLDEQARELGTTLADLRNQPLADLDPTLGLVRLHAEYLENDTDNNLASAPDQLTEEERRLLDAIIGQLEPQRLIAQDQFAPKPDDQSSDPTVKDTDDPGASKSATAQQPFDNQLKAISVGRALPETAFTTTALGFAAQSDCRTVNLEITTAAELAAAIETGKDAQISQDGAVSKLVSDVVAVADSTGYIPGVGNVTNLVAALYTGVNGLRDSVNGAYPTELTEITANASIVSFNEDFTTPGEISDVRLTATSTGFDASDVAAQVATRIVNAVVGKAIGKIATGTADVVSEVVMTAGGELRGYLTGVLLAELASGQLNICPNSWTVPLQNDTYVEILAESGLLTVNQSSFSYEPEEVGADTLIIKARGPIFSNLDARTTIEVETKQIQVLATPADIWVDTPGEVVEITTEILNADTTTLDWDPGPGSWTDGGPETNDGATRLLQTPSSAFDSFIVTVESTSETGLRADATDVRLDTVTVRLRELIVEPNPGSVQVEGQLTFTARNRDGDSVDVEWSATGGSINDAGVYTAGTEPGTYTVTATRTDDPSISTTVSVRVINEECIVGVWQIQFGELMQQIAATSGLPATIGETSGEYLMEIRGDGTFTGYRNALQLSMSAQGSTFVMTIDSVDPGTWAIEGDVIFITDLGGAATVQMSVDGRPVPFGGTQTVEAEPVSGSGPFTCVDGQTITFTADGITSTMNYVGPVPEAEE